MLLICFRSQRNQWNYDSQIHYLPTQYSDVLYSPTSTYLLAVDIHAAFFNNRDLRHTGAYLLHVQKSCDLRTMEFPLNFTPCPNK